MHVPTEEQEDEMLLHRERERRKKERTAQITRIRHPKPLRARVSAIEALLKDAKCKDKD